MKKFYALIILFVFTFITQSYGETGTAEADDIWTRKKLTGDWYGLRSDLAEHGINLDFRLSQYYQGVTSGGKNTNGAYGGHLTTTKKTYGYILAGQ